MKKKIVDDVIYRYLSIKMKFEDFYDRLKKIAEKSFAVWTSRYIEYLRYDRAYWHDKIDAYVHTMRGQVVKQIYRNIMTSILDQYENKILTKETLLFIRNGFYQQAMSMDLKLSSENAILMVSFLTEILNLIETTSLKTPVTVELLYRQLKDDFKVNQYPVLIRFWKYLSDNWNLKGLSITLKNARHGYFEVLISEKFFSFLIVFDEDLKIKRVEGYGRQPSARTKNMYNTFLRYSR